MYTKPAERDLITEDRVHFYQGGDLVVTVPPGTTWAGMWVALRAHMARRGEWVNVWIQAGDAYAHLLNVSP